MTGRRREGLAPNLFPFLAVLICTLGTLILLLALVAQNAGDAIASTTAPPSNDEQAAQQRKLAETDQALDRRFDEVRWQLDQVVHTRDEQTREIDERRTRKALIEDHVKRLRQELLRLDAEVTAAQDSSQATVKSQAAIAALKAQVVNEKAKIEKLKDEQQTKSPRIVIVPHKGPNGTDRRPIYIECRANGVYLQPGNVAIDPKYLETNFNDPRLNPLDAALRTIRTYSMQNYGDVDAPYPLIVVRPDGINTYSAARFAMKGWDDQFGYELVPDDVKLAYPEADNVLNEKVEEAIAQAVLQQQSLARSGYGRGGNGNGSGSGDSFVRGSSAGEAVSQPTGSSGQAGVPQAGAGLASGGNPPRRSSDFPVLSARSMDASAQAALEGFGSPNAGRSRQSIAAERSAAAAAAENATVSDAQLAAEAAQLAGTKPGQSTGTGKPTGSESGGSEPSSTTSPSYAGLNNQPQLSQNGKSGQPVDAKSAINNDPNATVSDVASNSNGSAKSINPNAPIGGTQAMGTADASNPAGTATPPPDNNAAASNQPPGSPPQPRVNIDVNGQTPPKKLVKRNGNDWALPPDVAAMVGTSMVRMIRVECHDDRLVLLPEGGRGATNVYGFTDGDIDRASLEMATAIRDRVDRWGAAMPGGRWHPLLDVNVMPGGEFRFQQLRRLLEGSGVEIKGTGAAQ